MKASVIAERIRGMDTAEWAKVMRLIREGNGSSSIELQTNATRKQINACFAQHMSHESNEWADAATNGITWLRNIRDGISTPQEALAEMEQNVARIRKEFSGGGAQS